MFFIGKLSLVGCAFDVLTESAVKRLVYFLHKEVKIGNLKYNHFTILYGKFISISIQNLPKFLLVQVIKNRAFVNLV